MTDLLADQAAIRARHKLTRDRSGQFVRPDVQAQYRAKLLETTKELEREIFGKACCRVRKHTRTLHREAVQGDDLLVMA